MSISAEQIKESEDAYQMFKITIGEAYAPYRTAAVEDHNLRAMIEWGAANLPNGFTAFKEVGAYELSFRNCAENGLLQRDPTWFSKKDRRALFVRFNNSLPVETSKIIYFGQLSAHDGLLDLKQLAMLNILGGEAAFKRFMDEEA